MTIQPAVASPTPDAAAPLISRLQLPSFSVVRVQADAAQPPTGLLPALDAAAVIIQLRPFRSHRLWRNGRLIFSGGHAQGCVAITDLRDDWRCHHRSGFDNLRLQVERKELQRIARTQGKRGTVSLASPDGVVDPTLLSLAHAYLPALSHPHTVPKMYVEHLTYALLTHVLAVYGNAVDHGRRHSRLSEQQERLAKEWMSARLFEDISVDEIARHCQLSRSHFIKAFRENTGTTPYRWLLAQRIESAKALLAGPSSIAEISYQCGFSDQSHFTRVFRQLSGVSPAVWRKHRPSRR